MKVHATKYPDTVLNIKGQTFRFVGGFADIPDNFALELVQSNPLYEVVKDSMPVVNYTRFNPASWREGKKVIWDGPIGYNNGYGKASMMAIEGLAKYCNLYVINNKWIGSVYNYVRPELTKIMDKATDKIDSFYIKFFPAFEFKQVTQRYIGYTMLEATRIPQSWVELINNNCERCIVPTQHQYNAFIDSGVKVDVKVIPLGIIPAWFPYLKPSTDEQFVFGTMGTLTYRKGTDILVKAFLKAFPAKKYPQVKLVLKQLGPLNWFIDQDTLLSDHRIMLLTNSMSPDKLINEFFASLDCFVFPTRGEGFGLPVMEAMACGKPVIVTNYSGPAEFINNYVAYPLEFNEVLVPDSYHGGYPKDLAAPGQKWAEPNLEHLIALMQQVYNNRKAAAVKGRNASRFIYKNFNVEVMGKRLVDYLTLKF